MDSFPVSQTKTLSLLHASQSSARLQSGCQDEYLYDRQGEPFHDGGDELDAEAVWIYVIAKLFIQC